MAKKQLQKSIFDQKLCFKIGFWLVFGQNELKYEKSHKEPTKIGVRAHIATSNGFPNFLTPRENRIEKSNFVKIFKPKFDCSALCVNVNNQDPDFQALEKSNDSAFLMENRPISKSCLKIVKKNFFRLCLFVVLGNVEADLLCKYELQTSLFQVSHAKYDVFLK